VVNCILNKTVFKDGPDGDAGLQKLLVDKVYTAAYPLHDGTAHDNDERGELNRQWATVKQWNRKQPLNRIKNYFGVQVALYFAWLGFYTKMLVPLALLGMLCFLYGFFEVFTDPIK
jgi:Dimerisation domain of Ca+-activated chloride-channel, anoctamin/Calcium-activated chloride channel